MEDKIRLFVDMDGTLATFEPVENIETLYEKNYFLNLKPMQNVLDSINTLVVNHEDFDLYILSAAVKSPYAIKEKNEWLDKYLPCIDQEHRVFVNYGENKNDYIDNVTKKDFLLDDFTKNLKEWQGTGIKLLNGINDTNKSWQGQRANSFLVGGELTHQIKCCVSLTLGECRGIQYQIDKAKEACNTKKNGNLKEKQNERKKSFYTEH